MASDDTGRDYLSDKQMMQGSTPWAPTITAWVTVNPRPDLDGGGEGLQ